MHYIETSFPIEPLNELCRREGKARRPIYQMHKWWARRLGSAFRMILLTTFADEKVTPGELWDRFYGGWSPAFPLQGKVILDPFMGGGTTVVEALRLGCRVIGLDISPVAWFIVKKELEPVDISTLDWHFREIEDAVKEKILKLYRTPCPNGNHWADVMYVIWGIKVDCINCDREVKLVEREGDRLVWVSKKGRFTCSYCGQGDDVTHWVEEKGRAPDMEMMKIEYWCPVCRERGWKDIDEEDIALYQKAVELFENERANLPIGDAEIPEGSETNRLIARGYKRFSQLFNPRQLLCLGWIYREILKIQDEKVRELLTLCLSEATRANAVVLCRYSEVGGQLEPGLEGNYWPPDSPVENNVWGTAYGRGSFSARYGLYQKAMQWAQRPFELAPSRGAKKYTGDRLQPIFGRSPSDVLAGRANVWIDARSSEDMTFLPDGSVDAVITDPPYYGNRHYGEMADFFYVWQRITLSSKYPQFASTLSPKAGEIEVNKVTGKDDSFFIQGLTKVFKECYRVLKPEGLMVFTFHHAKAEAWAAVLQAILDSGFEVRAVWPYHSEAVGGWIRAWGIDFDMITVCAKRTGIPKEVSWESLKDEIALQAEKEIRRLIENHMHLSDADMFIITMGKTTAIYSQHWPNVLREGQQILPKTAVPEIEEEVDFKLDEMILGKGLPETLDSISRAYLQHLAARPEVTVSYLRKVSQWRGIEQEEWLDGKYVQRTRGGSFRVLRPDQPERYEHLKRLWEEGSLVRIIDLAHYLYGLDAVDNRPLPDSVRAERKLIKVMDFLSKVSRDRRGAERFAKLRDLLRQRRTG